MDGQGVFIGHFAEENNQCNILENLGRVKQDVIQKMTEVVDTKFDLTDQSVAFILYKPPNHNKNPPGLTMIKNSLVEQGMDVTNIHTQTYAAPGGAFASTKGPRGKLVVDWTKREGGNHLALYMQNDQPTNERDFGENGNLAS